MGMKDRVNARNLNHDALSLSYGARIAMDFETGSVEIVSRNRTDCQKMNLFKHREDHAPDCVNPPVCCSNCSDDINHFKLHNTQ